MAGAQLVITVLLAAASAFTPSQRRFVAQRAARSGRASATHVSPHPHVSRGGALAAASRDELLGEATGTAILLAFGYGSVASKELAGALSLSGLAAVWGLGVALGAAVSSDLSGGHMNPAVTVALAACGKFPARKIAPYVAAQLAGAAFASVLTSATWGLPLGAPAPWVMGFGPGVAARRACFVEGWQTAALAVAVFASGGRRHGPTFPTKAGPLVAGATVAALICLGGPLTGAGFNPARDLAPRLVAALAGAAGAFPAGWWAYTVGPVVGAVVGGMFCVRALRSDEASGASY